MKGTHPTPPRRLRTAALRGFAATAALAALVLAGCGGSDGSSGDGGTSASTSAQDKPVHVGFFLLATANSWSQSQLEAARAKAEELGDVTVDEFDGGFDPAKQVNQLQDAVTSGKYDAFLLSANSGVALSGATKQAIDAGIPVVATYEAIGPDLNSVKPQVPGLTGTIILPPIVQGRQAAEPIVNACRDIDPCNIAYIANGIGTPSEDEKMKGFKEVLTPNVKIVATSPNAGFLAAGGLRAAEDILQAHDDLDGIFTSSDQSTLGAEQALRNAGRLGDLWLAGMGCATPAVERVMDGRWIGSSCTAPITQAQTALDIAVRAARGEKLTPAETEIALPDLDSFPKGADRAALAAVDFKGQYPG